MLAKLGELFDGFGPTDRKILALCFLCLTVVVDYTTGLLPTFILYVLCIVWCSNSIGGRFATAFAVIAAFFHIDSPEYAFLKGYRPVLYLNIAATFLIIDAALQYKNKILAQLYNLLAHVESQSLTDPLTEIPNRRAFVVRLEAALSHAYRYSEPFSLAYIDIDNFKQVNDTVNHAAGDQLLRLVAYTIQSELRGDDMVARLGGDEFGIIFTHAQQGIGRYVERVKQALDDQRALERAYQMIGFSIGVVYYDGKLPATINELIRYADELMYEVKKGEKNDIRFGTFSSQALLDN